MDLNGKTIFDFCKDEKILHKIVDSECPEDYYRGFPDVVIDRDLMKLAGMTGNKELFDAAERKLKKDKEEWQKAVEKAAAKGLIID